MNTIHVSQSSVSVSDPSLVVVAAGGRSRGMIYGERILQLSATDVLCGQQTRSLKNRGNEFYRYLIQSYKQAYALAARTNKKFIVEDLIEEVQTQAPPGRFLIRDKSCLIHRCYVEMPTDKLKLKIAKDLRRGKGNTKTPPPNIGNAGNPPCIHHQAPPTISRATLPAMDNIVGHALYTTPSKMSAWENVVISNTPCLTEPEPEKTKEMAPPAFTSGNGTSRFCDDDFMQTPTFQRASSLVAWKEQGLVKNGTPDSSFVNPFFDDIEDDVLLPPSLISVNENQESGVDFDADLENDFVSLFAPWLLPLSLQSLSHL